MFFWIKWRIYLLIGTYMHRFLLIRRWLNRLIMPRRKTPTQLVKVCSDCFLLYTYMMHFWNFRMTMRQCDHQHPRIHHHWGRKVGALARQQRLSASDATHHPIPFSKPIPKNSTGASHVIIYSWASHGFGSFELRKCHGLIFTSLWSPSTSTSGDDLDNTESR